MGRIQNPLLLFLFCFIEVIIRFGSNLKVMVYYLRVRQPYTKHLKCSLPTVSALVSF